MVRISFATRGPPAFTTGCAVSPLGANVGAAEVLAAAGFQHTSSPSAKATAGENVAVWACAVPVDVIGPPVSPQPVAIDVTVPAVAPVAAHVPFWHV